MNKCWAKRFNDTCACRLLQDTVREAVEAGYSFIALGTELLHIMNGADSVVATAQRTLGSTPLEDGQSPGGF